MLLSINPENPQQRLLDQAADVLRRDGVIIYPTDTVYGLGCRLSSKRGVERIGRIKNRERHKPLTVICENERQLQQYTQGFSGPVFKMLRRYLPGPYTFIFNASKTVPKVMLTKRKHVGIRWPDHPIAVGLVEALGEPILSCSLYSSEDRLFDDPEELHDQFEKHVDLVIDGGPIFAQHSSIIDFTNSPPEVTRIGKGPVEWIEEELSAPLNVF